MTSENEYQESEEDRGYFLIGGIYRVVKSIDEKMDTFIEEVRDLIESREENRWYEKGERSFYE